MVVDAGLEPASPTGRQILSLMRIPIPPINHNTNISYSRVTVKGFLSRNCKLIPSHLPKRIDIAHPSSKLGILILQTIPHNLHHHSMKRHNTSFFIVPVREKMVKIICTSDKRTHFECWFCCLYFVAVHAIK